ncbi:UDP-glucose 4-epimerase GalE [Terasakiella sp. A23]|uniref:UDP-glucose 4-epimerase GalE n=1 Tax=Terasakiella sp. FCG-A23 TaxID=3080561 RepID=UPI002954241B|nr:UDP-glucose 4-epimerase GalE [Terasakiella sp. A23]MDV7341620.1 UDP-glucose 4-epimerase GalE [Terasakiella sp. A23]
MTKETKREKVLVTGGAGYIGSHAVLALLDAGFEPIILDNLSTGEKRLLPEEVELIVGNIADEDLLISVIETKGINNVMHFAGSIVVSESVKDPLKYYANNTENSFNLLKICLENKVKNFIFSSTASVYGNVRPDGTLSEDDTLDPTNPYGRSKLMTEMMIRDCACHGDFNFAILRYFNVAGADPQGRTGQAGPNSTHLIRVACEAALGKREGMEIYGDDYETHDGTCIRDYIHVSDLASAHVKALNYINQEKKNLVLNVGYSKGYSVREVINEVKRISGADFKVDVAPRRAGDPMVIIANNSKIKSDLNWTAKYNDLSVIVKTALEWMKKSV